MQELKRIDFAGGGTAGHLFPALSLAQEFKRRFPSCEIRFWGTKRGVEYRLRHQLGFQLSTIKIRGFRRSFALSNFLIPVELPGSLLFLIFHFLFNRSNLVIGTGGYVSAPVVFAARVAGISTAVQEQNSYPGVTTRLLSRVAKRVYLTYDSSRQYFKNQGKIEVFGNPVRQMKVDLDRESAAKKFGLAADKKTLLVFGGSQGGLGLNKLLLGITRQLLADDRIQIVWATGPNHFDKIARESGDLEGLHLFAFIEDMYTAYTACDLTLCRAGATTIAELTYLGIPAILIPFPFATGDHQKYNAMELEKTGAAKYLPESETTGDILLTTIKALIDDDSRLAQMKKKMKGMAKPNAAHDIVSDLCKLILVD